MAAIFAATGIGMLAAPAAAEPGQDPSAGATPTPTATSTPTEPAPDPAGEGDAHQLVITVHGTTVTAGGVKTGILSVYNQGPNNVVDAAIDFDLGALDTDKVDFQLLPIDNCPAPSKTGIRCLSIGTRTTLDVLFRLIPVEGADPGPAGMITAVMTDSLHDGVDAPAHVLTFPVSIAPSGADLLVWAPDQPFQADGSTGKIKRGADGSLSILIVNQGDQTVNGVRVTTKLVKGATFTDLDGCTVSADKATLTCEFTDLRLIPAGQDTNADDDLWSAVEFTPGVHIAADAKSPKGWPDLPGNTIAVEPLAVDPVSTDQRNAVKTATTLPTGVKGVSLAKLDLDATDNTDDFTIMVAAADSTGGDSDTGGQGGGSGSLPITGAPVVVVAAAGLAVILLGGLLLFLTRRRKATND